MSIETREVIVRSVARSFHVALAALAAALLCTPALAEGSDQPGSQRFVPSFAFESGVTVHEWNAAVESRLCRECSLSDPAATPVEARPSASGHDFDVTPFVHGSLELMTPEFPLPLSPRLFVGGEFGGGFGTERKVAREGDASTVGSPLDDEAETTAFAAEQATGQGSEVVAQYGDYVYGVHAGVAVPFEMFGRQFRLRPSVGWTRFEIEVTGNVSDAECQQGGGVCNESGGGFLRGTTLTSGTTESYDGVGPGLELEMDTGRLGPLGASLVLGVRGYKILGDTEIEFTAPVVVRDDAAGRDEYDARFRFEVEEWVYGARVGLRFHWLGASE